jgi:hypothetical protein
MEQRNEDQQQQQQQKGWTKFPMYNGKRLDHFLVEDFSEHIKSARFKIGVFRIGITLQNVQDAQEPDELLERILNFLIEDAVFESPNDPEKFSIIIRSALLEKPIQIPYRTFEQNTPEAIMREFEKVEQSGKRKGRPSLFSEPIHIEIVMGPSKEEVYEILNSSTGSGRRRHSEVVRNIKRSSLIEVKSQPGDECSRLCLFKDN